MVPLLGTPPSHMYVPRPSFFFFAYPLHDPTHANAPQLRHRGNAGYSSQEHSISALSTTTAFDTEIDQRDTTPLSKECVARHIPGREVLLCVDIPSKS